ncbi:hypothetical protein SDC9_82623 [bioreactor metagenome]|uniref:SLH domain-containing protein n=1 Tax=bioreactor metagenome TaxID=1076179 RepID=A0A644Z6W7_9ZZZZ
MNAGFAQGSGGRLRPLERMTRAELARLMDNLLRQYLRVPGVVTQVVPGGVMVNVPGVTLRDLTVNGDLIVGDGVGDGACVLENVTVAGRLVVRGGGEDGIILRGGSSVAEVVMSRGGGTVSLKVESGADAGDIRIDEGSADVNLYGTVDTVAVEASGVRVKAFCASIGRIDVIGGNTGISVDAESVVGEVTVQGAAANTLLSVAGAVAGVTTAAPGTTVEGLGKVAWVEVRCGADNARVETSGTQIQTASR